jgi:type IV pilus assembly protein PilO
MKELFDKVFEAELPVKLGILVGSLVLLFGGFYFLFYSPVLEQVSSLDEDINGSSGLRSKISFRQGMAENLGRYQERVRILDIELDKALQELPDEREMDILLSKIAEKARDSGLEIRLFRPGNEQKHDFYAALPVHVEVLGTYHQVATFFDEVGHMERIVNLNNITLINPKSLVSKKGTGRGGDISASERNNVMLESSVVGTAFRFLDESERPQVEDKKDRQRRGRKPRSR